jgi:hypothetical protein
MNDKKEMQEEERFIAELAENIYQEGIAKQLAQKENPDTVSDGNK